MGKQVGLSRKKFSFSFFLVRNLARTYSQVIALKVVTMLGIQYYNHNCNNQQMGSYENKRINELNIMKISAA